jgi:hypothetical protein
MVGKEGGQWMGSRRKGVGRGLPWIEYVRP